MEPWRLSVAMKNLSLEGDPLTMCRNKFPCVLQNLRNIHNFSMMQSVADSLNTEDVAMVQPWPSSIKINRT